MDAQTFDNLLGKTIWKIERQEDDNGEIYAVKLRLDDRTLYSMYDEEFYTGNDACVRLVDVDGALDDLLGKPLVVAECVSGKMDPSVEYSEEYSTWTFYRFATEKSFVTLRWGGRSNGYYSETVTTTSFNDLNCDSDPDYLAFVAQRQNETITKKLGAQRNISNTSAIGRKM